MLFTSNRYYTGVLLVFFESKITVRPCKSKHPKHYQPPHINCTTIPPNPKIGALSKGFAANYTIIMTRNPLNTIGNY